MSSTTGAGPSDGRTNTGPSKASIAIVIAIVSAITSIAAASIKGYFDYVHIDPRLRNLIGVDIASGDWSQDNSPDCQKLRQTVQDINFRGCSIEISYGKHFFHTPQVLVSVGLLDAATTDIVRYKLLVQNIGLDGFRLHISTTGDMAINLIQGWWLAYDQARFEQAEK